MSIYREIEELFERSVNSLREHSGKICNNVFVTTNVKYFPNGKEYIITVEDESVLRKKVRISSFNGESIYVQYSDCTDLSTIKIKYHTDTLKREKTLEKWQHILSRVTEEPASILETCRSDATKGICEKVREISWELVFFIKNINLDTTTESLRNSGMKVHTRNDGYTKSLDIKYLKNSEEFYASTSTWDNEKYSSTSGRAKDSNIEYGFWYWTANSPANTVEDFEKFFTGILSLEEDKKFEIEGKNGSQVEDVPVLLRDDIEDLSGEVTEMVKRYEKFFAPIKRAVKIIEKLQTGGTERTLVI